MLLLICEFLGHYLFSTFQCYCKYMPLIESDIMTMSSITRQYNFSADNIFKELVPCKLIQGLVSSAAYMEHYQKMCSTFDIGERTGLVVRASDSGSGDPGSILGRVGVLFP